MTIARSIRRNDNASSCVCIMKLNCKIIVKIHPRLTGGNGLSSFHCQKEGALKQSGESSTNSHDLLHNFSTRTIAENRGSLVPEWSWRK